MSTGLWINQDGLPLEYGTQKTVPEVGGDFDMPGARRMIEVTIDLTSLTTSPVIQSMNTFFPAGTNVIIEQVDVFAETPATSGGSAVLDVGLGYPTSSSTYSNVTQNINGTAYTLSTPSVTSISDTALVAALPLASLQTEQQFQVLYAQTTYAGAYIGTGPYNTTTAQNLAHPCYITAKYGTAAFTAGVVKVRVWYRGIGTITY